MAVPHKPDGSWSNDDLAEDVATISYEQALRSQTRSSPPSSGQSSAPAKPKNAAGRVSTSNPGLAATHKPLKTSSITIRLSEPECAQLRRRAAEAELTISAYLRSCTLEVESLRAQVKQTLAELRSCAAKPGSPEARPESFRRIPNLFAAFRDRFRLIRRRKAPAIGLNSANPLAPFR